MQMIKVVGKEKKFARSCGIHFDSVDCFIFTHSFAGPLNFMRILIV